MRPGIPLALGAVLLAASGLHATAQTAEEPTLPEQLDRALRDMMEGVQPTLEEALEYMRSFGAIDDPRHYELPELLPNGDIIIRRREDAPAFRPDAPDAPDEAPAGDLPFDPKQGIRT